MQNVSAWLLIIIEYHPSFNIVDSFRIASLLSKRKTFMFDGSSGHVLLLVEI